MAVNTNNNYRIGAVRQREQIQQELNKLFVKRNSITKQFLDVKSNTKFKGIRFVK
jgi:hypothetical protein